MVVRNLGYGWSLVGLFRVVMAGGLDAAIPRSVRYMLWGLSACGFALNLVWVGSQSLRRSAGGGGNGDLYLLELVDGRSYKLQCRSASRTREADECMGEGLLTQRS